MRRIINWGATLLLVIGAATLGYVAFAYLQAEGFQAYRKWAFHRQLSEAQPSTPPSAFSPVQQTGPRAASLTGSHTVSHIGSTVGQIEIPRLHLSTIVVEGDSDAELKLAAGHVPGTALPGQPGNLVIAAHRDTFFRPLRKIAVHDRIVLVTPAGVFHYRVVSIQITDPSHTEALEPTTQPQLTLITCYPFYYIGPAPKRFIVRASREG